MKKLFAIIAVFGAMTFGLSQSAMAQDEVETAAAADTTAVSQDSTEVDSAAVDAAAVTDAVAEDSVVEGSLHKELKTKFIEGGADFMSLVAIALVLGLAFCIERIVYLSLAEVNTKKLLESLEEKLNAGDVEGAKDIARNTRGPVASICYQGLLRINEDLDAIERSITSYGAVQATYLEKGCSWITLFIAMAPSLGFLGTVIGMVMAFDQIQQAGDISPTVVAGGMKVALITTIFGIVVALILQVFYNYILSKIEAITSQMEDASITLMDMIMKAKLKK
jgi:biopolymer transport protein ExbB